MRRDATSLSIVRMAIGSHTAARILIGALRFSLFVQLVLGNAYGALFQQKIFGVDAGRKILRDEQRKYTPAHDHYGPHISFISKIMVIAVPGMVIFGCAFPRFWKKKEIPHGSVPMGPNSRDSASSFEMNSIHEKVQASPRRHPPQSPKKHPPPSPRLSLKPSRLGSVDLSFELFVKATQNFSTASYMGEGGFGSVYKGQLQDGQVVAIQQAKKEHFDSTTFNREVEILLKIDHRNLVRFLGCVDRGNERLIVTEYVPNGTLRQHLDGERGKILDFNQRLEICIDVAHGLTYLHLYAEKTIIHRDIKSSNILLTDSMRAKLADFGCARVDSLDTGRTHISTKVNGTVGYLDPEYMRTHQLTAKSDVYSFGILLLEILTGRRPVESTRPSQEKVLIKWVFSNYTEHNIAGLVDPLMDESLSAEILQKMFGLAIHCAAPIRKDRPDMKEVGERLWAIRVEYKRGMQ